MARKQSRKKSTKSRRKSTKSTRMMVALQKLKRMNPSHQRQAIKLSNDAFIRTLCNDVKKMRTKPLPPALSRRMKKHRKHLQKLIHKNTSISTKRNMLSQRGGFAIFPLIMAALPAIGSMIGNAIRRTRRR